MLENVKLNHSAGIKIGYDKGVDEERARIKEIVEEWRKNLLTDNNIEGSFCNPRCHDSGKDDMAERILALLSKKE